MAKSVFDTYKVKQLRKLEDSSSAYLVEEISSGKEFILKEMPEDLSLKDYETFVKEFSQTGDLSSSVTFATKILNFISDDEKSYILMEYRNEKSLQEIMRYPSLGKILNNRYLVISGIASGGFGRVYLVKDMNLPEKYWAVKEMQQESGEGGKVIERSFRVEAEMLSKIEHKSIPRITDFFIDQSKMYLVMDFVRGETLKEKSKKLKDGSYFSEEVVIKWALDLCNVLDYLHNLENPVIFRDLKPDNIMVNEKGELKLIDFGIARVYEGSSSATTKYALLTEGYAPQEQWLGKAEPRSDIYALGATLYFLLSGVHPKKVAPDFPPVEEFNLSVSRDLSRIVSKAVEQKMADRYQTVREMEEAILEVYGKKEGAEKAKKHFENAKKYEEKNDSYSANFEYLTALKLDPKNYEILFGAGNTCEKLGFTDKAKEYYKNALKQNIPSELKNKIEKKLSSMGEVFETCEEEDPEVTIPAVVIDYNTLPYKKEEPFKRDKKFEETKVSEVVPETDKYKPTEIVTRRESKKPLLLKLLAGTVFFVFFIFLAGGILLYPSVKKWLTDGDLSDNFHNGNGVTGPTGNSGPLDTGTDSSQTNGSEDNRKDWKTILLENLKNKEPGFTYCAAGDAEYVVASIDGSTHKNTHQWKFDDRVVTVALKPDGSELWCVATEIEQDKIKKEKNVIIINPETGELIDTIDCPGVIHIAFTPDGKKAYFSIMSADEVAVFDVQGRKELKRIKVGKHPAGISLSFDGTRAYVGHGPYSTEEMVTEINGYKLPKPVPRLEDGSEFIAVIDTVKDECIKKIEPGGWSLSVAVSPDGKLLYGTVDSLSMSDVYSGTGGYYPGANPGKWDGIAAIDTSTYKVIKKIIIPDMYGGPSAVAFTPDGKKAYAICGKIDSATPIDVTKHEPLTPIALDVGG